MSEENLPAVATHKEFLSVRLEEGVEVKAESEIR